MLEYSLKGLKRNYRSKDGEDYMDTEEKIKEEKIYTINDIYALAEGERAELIHGQIYYMAPPSWTHQKLSRKLHQAIANLYI